MKNVFDLVSPTNTCIYIPFYASLHCRVPSYFIKYFSRYGEYLARINSLRWTHKLQSSIDFICLKLYAASGFLIIYSEQYSLMHISKSFGNFSFNLNRIHSYEFQHKLHINRLWYVACACTNNGNCLKCLFKSNLARNINVKERCNEALNINRTEIIES